MFFPILGVGVRRVRPPPWIRPWNQHAIFSHHFLVYIDTCIYEKRRTTFITENVNISNLYKNVFLQNILYII
jgi:hypothetical protein